MIPSGRLALAEQECRGVDSVNRGSVGARLLSPARDASVGSQSTAAKISSVTAPALYSEEVNQRNMNAQRGLCGCYRMPTSLALSTACRLPPTWSF
jgi:hypothetical protein